MRPSRLQSLLFVGLTVAIVGSCRADIVFDLTPSTLSTSPGQTVEFTGSLTNTGAADVFLNGDVSLLPYPTLMVDDSPFFADAPLFLPPGGGSYSGPFFDVIVNPSAVPGIYKGSFTIQGGADSTFFDNLASQPFQVTVTAPVPEPRTILLLAAELAIILWIWWRRMSHQR